MLVLENGCVFPHSHVFEALCEMGRIPLLAFAGSSPVVDAYGRKASVVQLLRHLPGLSVKSGANSFDLLS